MESVLRKLYEVVSLYGLVRVPLKMLAAKEGEANPFDSKWVIAGEVALLCLLGAVRSAGCLVRFMSEEIIQQS